MNQRPDTWPVAEPEQFGPRTVISHVDVDTLSPRQIRRMLLEAETGELASQAALFEKMEEKDG